MKKILILLLCFCVSLSMFSCKKKDENDSKSGNQSKDTETSKAELSDFVEESDFSEAEESLLTEDSSECEDSFDTIEDVSQAFAQSKFQQMDKLNYVALGDSIARGYGLESPADGAYPALLFASLVKALPTTEINYNNYAVDGLTTKGLIQLMSDGCEGIDGADLFTLCIGANNLLQPFLEVIEKHMPELVSSSGQVDHPIAQSSALINAIRAIEAEVESDEFALRMEAGVADLKSDLVGIISELKRRAPAADIVITTVYSPYHGINLSVPYIDISFDLGAISDKWVSALNVEIRQISVDNKCVLVDPYTVFEETGGCVNAQISLIPASTSFDPHPNAKGHEILADMHFKAISLID